ncbi:hypothetical protein CapIbe_021215 [Capra ibex]
MALHWRVSDSGLVVFSGDENPEKLHFKALQVFLQMLLILKRLFTRYHLLAPRALLSSVPKDFTTSSKLEETT